MKIKVLWILASYINFYVLILFQQILFCWVCEMDILMYDFTDSRISGSLKVGYLSRDRHSGFKIIAF